MRSTSSGSSGTGSSGSGSGAGQGRTETFEEFQARQAVDRYFAKRDAAAQRYLDGDNLFPLLGSDPGPVGGGQQATAPAFAAPAASGTDVGGYMLTGWGSFHSNFSYRDDAGVRTDYYGVVGTSVGKRMTVDEARAYDLEDYYTKMRNGTLPQIQPVDNGPGIARNIGAVEGFFTFNAFGRGLKSYAESAYNIVTGPFVGAYNLTQDAYGFSKQKVFGPEIGLMGDVRPYAPQSGIVRSVMTKGGLATVGDILHGIVMSAPGIGVISGLYHRNPDEVGAAMPGTLLAAAGSGQLLRSSDRLVMNSGGDRLIGTMGPARLNNAVEFNAIVDDLTAKGVDISFREGQFAYGPAPSGGRPGNIVFDRDASLSAIKHEYGHFLDDEALGFPGQRHYYENPGARMATERRQYLGEIRTARELGDTYARRQLIEDYLGEKRYLIENYYNRPYGPH